MILKSVEIQGFKSFPDKTKLEFNQGVTAVVGPNGSGKSNIGDALRWVLGEQSSKTLRGAKMEDIIFSGTAQRKAVGFASVSLHLDNSDRTLDIDSDEVSVSRKLYRSGDSSYRINGASVRLKDVVSLFMDTGLGKDGYAIVGQGKIADIVSSKSEERREIFEEAAGISKYRFRKKEAQRKLEQTEENLVRIKDIITELEDRVAPLFEQSEKAKAFLSLSEEKKKAEVSLWMHTLETANGKLRTQQERIDNLSFKSEEIDKQLTDLEKENENSFETVRKLALQSEENERDRNAIEEQMSAIGAGIAVEKNNLLHLEEEEKKLAIQQENSGEKTKQLQEEIEELSQSLAKIEEEYQRLRVLETQTREALQESLAQNSETTSRKEKLEQEVLDKKLALSSLTTKQSSFESQFDTLRENRETLSHNQQVLKGQLAEKEVEESQTKQLLDDISEDIATQENMKKGYAMKAQSLQNNFVSAEQSLKETEQKLFEIAQKIKVNEELDKNLDGFFYSVKAVLQGAQERKLKGILGPIAQLIQVDNKYSVAIETALGSNAQHIVVENEASAKEAIYYLKQKKAGRATFLPLNVIAARGKLEKTLAQEQGAVAVASDLVTADKRYAQIMESLLGKTLIVEDLDSADALARKHKHRFRIVTLDGQVINAGGSFTGGSQGKNSGLFTRKAHIEALQKQQAALEKERENLRAHFLTQEKGFLEIKEEIEKKENYIRVLTEDKIRTSGEFARVSDHVQRLREQQSQAQTAFLEVEKQLAEKTKEESQTANERADLESAIAALEADLLKEDSFQGEKQDKKDALLAELTEIGMSILALEKDKQLAQSKEDAAKQSLAELEKSQGETAQNLAQAQEKREGFLREIQALTNQQETLAQQKASLAQTLADIVKRQGEIEKDTADIRAKERQLLEEREACKSELARESERKTNMQNEYDLLIDKLWDEYELTRSEAETLASPVENTTALRAELAKLKEEIRKIGNVNVGAIEEYTLVKERYDFMSAQLADIEKSKKELTHMIGDITQEMVTLFTKAFHKINTEFNRVFQELFGGGKASLELTDPEHILESGIEIFVQPPGKVIKSLSLLSGGEQSFVAIAIYFAILHIRPTSFCLLDEIEAALDDVNVVRFASYLKSLTSHTQFIVVSHRRGTMDQADMLYGVTMQEEGVSKLLRLESRGEQHDFLAGERIG